MSESLVPGNFPITPASPTKAIPPPKDLDISTSLNDLQTDEQRRILDTIGKIRKCRLESILSLPQLVVCGDQSAGKSSVLEALTEIPFPRNDNLCTRFATEIRLRRARSACLTISIIPDESRPASEKAEIKAFKQSITDFTELPKIMDLAMNVMGVNNGKTPNARGSAFSRDVLSIEISGPTRPQLTLVDIPGLIATSTKGVTKADVDMVTEITDSYISQPRTICLAVVTAMNDYANQKILEKVREVDPVGDRTLGIITKPDMLAAGSGSETSFIGLAKNEDIYFKLGWHVVKNRKFEETNFSLVQRNISEDTFFRTSNFKVLKETGIDSLRCRLSALLFEHVKKELPKLREDLELALLNTRQQLDTLGSPRSTAADCKNYIAELSLVYYELCKAAVNGHYENPYFHRHIDIDFSPTSESTVCRTRAVIQYLNTKFADYMRVNGRKYQVNMEIPEKEGNQVNMEMPDKAGTSVCKSTVGFFDLKVDEADKPKILNKKEGLDWVRKVLIRTRGKELIGSFNPLLIGELFWEQSSKWAKFAGAHVDQVSKVCTRFLEVLLADKCPKDVKARLWTSKIEVALRARKQAAIKELGMLMEDLTSYPINYNQYYTDTILECRSERQKAAVAHCVKQASTATQTVTANGNLVLTNFDLKKAVASYSTQNESNMDNFSCEEALDCLFAIYAVSEETFIANVTTQVIERHIVRGLENIFSPFVVSKLEPEEAEALASEPNATKRHREYLVGQIQKLEEANEIFRSVM